jgi:ubiquinone/menaquinone biosynthesis C-methylase UbiE
MVHPEDVVLDPKKILTACDISKEHNIADFGCGPGIFSIPVAELASDGTVYCFDVLPSALEAVNSRAQIIGLNNIVTRRANLEKEKGTGLDDAQVSHVIMRKILLQNENRSALFSEAFRVLSAGGNLLVIGWAEDAVQGFGMENRLAAEEVERMAEESGFSDKKKVDAGKYHYAFVFMK